MDDADLFGDLYPVYRHEKLDIDEYDRISSPLIVNKPKTPDPIPVNEFSNKVVDAHDVDRGVTINWLSQAFGMKRKNVEERLRGVPTLRTGPRNSKVYDFKVAVGHLAAPQINIKRYIQELDPKDMPEQLRRPYWAARREEQKAREEAGDLWRSDDVLNVFAELFTLIKSNCTLWSNRIAQENALTLEQRKLIDREAKHLMSDIAEMVTKLQDGRLTPSQLSDFDEDDDDRL